MKGYKYSSPTIPSFSSMCSTASFDEVNCEKTPFFKGGGFDLVFFEGGGHWRLLCSHILFLCSFRSFLCFWDGLDLDLWWNERNEKIFMVLVHAWWYRSSMLVLFVSCMHIFVSVREKEKIYI